MNDEWIESRKFAKHTVQEFPKTEKSRSELEKPQFNNGDENLNKKKYST